MGNRRYRNFVWDSQRWEGFELRDGDIIISTAPKAGTTWMQMQVALLLFRTPDLPAPMASLSPWLDMLTRPRDEVVADLDAQTHRRFIKTHTPLDGLPWREDVTYVHVSRDPRDMALSWDDHLANVDQERFFTTRVGAVGMDDLAELPGFDGPPEPPLEDPAERFWAWIERPADQEPIDGLPAATNHAATFWDRRHEPNVHLFHYGDQTADLGTEMTRLARALGVDAPSDELVDAARFDRMKARAPELAPNTDTPFWVNRDDFFRAARNEAWHTFVDGQESRYEAAAATVCADEALRTWLHGGCRAQPVD